MPARKPPAAARRTHACRSASLPGSRGRAAPARNVGRPLPPTGGWPPSGAARADRCQAHPAPRGPSDARPAARFEDRFGTPSRPGTGHVRSAGPASRARGPGQPVTHRGIRGETEGHGALLGSLAEYAQHPSMPVKVVDVEPGELRHPDAGAVEQLDHGAVTTEHCAGEGIDVGCPRRNPESRGLNIANRPDRSGAPRGSRRSGRGVDSRTAGSVASSPARTHQAVNDRAAAARLPSEVRAAPWLRDLASQLRRTERSSAVRSGGPDRCRWSSNEMMSVR